MNTQPQPQAGSIERGDLALLMIRAALAAVFVFHGAQSLFGAFDGDGILRTAERLYSLGVPFPVLGAAVLGAIELLGGVAVLSGVWMRWAVAPMAAMMLAASVAAHGGFDVRTGGMEEYPLTLAVILGALGLMGPGALTARALSCYLFGEAACKPEVQPVGQGALA